MIVELKNQNIDNDNDNDIELTNTIESSTMDVSILSSKSIYIMRYSGL